MGYESLHIMEFFCVQYLDVALLSFSRNISLQLVWEGLHFAGNIMAIYSG